MSAVPTGSPVTIENAPLSRFHKRLTLFSSGGPFLDGYILGISGIALVPLTRQWHISTLWFGLLGASALIGVFIGGVVFGYLTDRIGRRLMYMIDLTVIVACSVAQFFVTDVVQLFVLRLLIGIAIGADYPIATALVTEFVPHRWRAKLVGGLNAMWFVGATVASFVGYALLNVDGGWRWMLLSSAVPAAVIIIGRVNMPESPRWLASKGRRAEALAVLRGLLGPQATLDDLPEPEQKTTFRRVVQAGYLGRTVFVTVFWTCTIVTLFAIYAFGPQILQLLHLGSGNESNLGYGLINVFFLAGNIVALAVVDRLGRRPLLIWGFAISAAGLLFLGVYPAAPVFAVTIAFAVYAVF
ncbi:MAG: MFS transporter, partial [Streptosporangiaceae bacterium]